MRTPILGLAMLAIAAPAVTSATAEVPIGALAPDFTLADAAGKPVTLAAFKGKTVVLEWNNPGCPFVQKHYGSGNMQKTQRAAGAQGVVWLTINSGAPGKQGHMNGTEAAAFVKAQKASPNAYLLDPEGKVGHLYAAKTTPHMYVIDPAGRLAYQGGIDDKPTANPADIASARNMVLAALGDMKAGRKVAVTESRAYGCTVKYAG
ncbi:redoxin domain-containing protein [Sphingomonas sp. AP4-R1]|uniref:redoxin domain-containing protein n=1 Tax=Sphingomonas sp. AP4-R1 TaxID=2735134 RepID=UPI001493AA2C|nr:redoxin domain-containing protein [Sphingomonas sp. AP4-R1]QJU59438.1 redoxin domain-containing protein [Sphingomonas sp. AP4-R1]